VTSRRRQYRLWQCAVVLCLGTIAANAGEVHLIGAAEVEEPAPPPQEAPPQQPTTAGVTPITLMFGNVTAGTAGAPQSATLVNTGTAPLTGIALGGALPAGFSDHGGQRHRCRFPRQPDRNGSCGDRSSRRPFARKLEPNCGA
jgi:hypothetical protein